MADYKTICSILSELWSLYRENKDLKEFMEYSDIGLPLAFFLAEGLVTEITTEGQLYVKESFDLFITSLGLNPETIEDGTTLSDLFAMSEDT